MFNQRIANRKQHHKNIIAWTKKYDNMINIAIGSIAIIIICIVLSNLIPQSAQARETLKNDKILRKMVEIDDIGHKQDDMLHALSGYNMGWDKIYHTIDNEYHTTQSKEVKLKKAEELNALIKEQSAFLHQIIQENPFSKREKMIFEKLEEEINQLSNQ